MEKSLTRSYGAKVIDFFVLLENQLNAFTLSQELTVPDTVLINSEAAQKLEKV